MRVRVDFNFSHGNDSESFVIDTSFAKAKNPEQQHLLDCIQAALLDPDKTTDFKMRVDCDFYSDMLSKSRKSDDFVTIWYS